ncbi:hypothetical protein OGAPHI_003327 [Ogataea philodendri]|uniref:Ribosomal lysine N-methyltransferase 4 n=2 Tax=Saccharomycotina TaxID=147537 RepID=A0A9P8P6U0_9ASCO|nr:uncharacterized protein OGAPHI_003327 [Ogataea philodendri]KAH3666878.1 hypothetical protein OGAPHI_003327 [Ogataea philodendri]
MDSFSKSTSGFDHWVRNHYQHVDENIEIADLRSSGEGRALRATGDIKKDTVLFRLARDHIINVRTAALGKLKLSNIEVLESLNQWEALILCLGYEMLLGEESQWSSYLQVLPEKFNSLMFWSDDELAMLKPSNVLTRIGRDQAERMHARLVPDMCVRLGSQKLADFLTLEKFHMVASIIMSYSFDVDDPEDDDVDEEEEEVNEFLAEEHDGLKFDGYLKSMVPLADTLNSNTNLVNANLSYENDVLVMTATKDIKKGEQIFNIYGELPNSEILRKYGYVEVPASKYDFAELSLSVIKQTFVGKYLSQFDNEVRESLFDKVVAFVGESEYLEETLEDQEGGIVLDAYEVFNDADVLPELVLLIQILTTVYESFESDAKWAKKLTKSRSELDAFVNRCILKSFQLLEKTMITKNCVINLHQCVQQRIAEYGEAKNYEIPETAGELSRSQMAAIVLKCEIVCLQTVLQKFPAKLEQIDDSKLLKNVLKRKSDSEEKKSKKRKA